jgi:hypothetical protein
MPGNRQHVPRPGQNVRAVLRIVPNIYILFASDFPLRIVRDRIAHYYARVVRCCATSRFTFRRARESAWPERRGEINHHQSFDEVSRFPRRRRPARWALTDLRNQFAIIPQDPQLFSTSIAENIRYGNLQATDAQVEAAARAAHAEVPGKYDTTWVIVAPLFLADNSDELVLC